MTKGFKDKNKKFHPITHPKGIRKKRDKSVKPTGVKIKTVTLKPESIKKVNKQIVKDINKDKSTNFSVALNELITKSRLKRDLRDSPTPQNEYKEVDGTFYKKNTPDEVITVLENSRLTGKRIRLFYGDKKTGWDWEESPNETTGTIGRSTGSIKIPLLVKTKRSMGGGAIIDDAIIKITEAGKDGKVLYEHPKYHQIRTIQDLEDDNFELITDSQDVESIKEERRIAFGKDIDDYDGFFADIKDGDYTAIFGFSGSVPALNKNVDRLL